MVKLKTIVLLILSLLLCNGESKSQARKDLKYVDKVMLQIPDSLTYSTQNIANYINSKFYFQHEKARAIFCWIAENIQYDFENRYAFNMYNSETNSDETLTSRNGICMNYANLYADIANKVGVKTYFLKGYTRKKKQVDHNPHAWCASMIDSLWYMTDPTWGAGYIQDSHFVKELNNKFFNIEPDRFIKTHIPFDPLWQFLNYPITKQEFHNGRSKTKNEITYFNFIDSIKIYENQSSIERLLASSSRIESNGICSYLDYDNLYSIRFNIKVHYKTLDEERYKTAYYYYNDGIYLLNEYINYANNYYLPYKGDAEIKQMLDDIDKLFNQALIQLAENGTSSLENEILQLKKLINQAIVELKEHKASLDKYLEIAKKYRESLSNANVK